MKLTKFSKEQVCVFKKHIFLSKRAESLFRQIIMLTLEPLSAHDVIHQESSVAVNIFLKATLKSRERVLRVTIP
jgi:hypothetical protein